jgi:uncharacterized repeat protein (TIGR03803 family)
MTGEFQFGRSKLNILVFGLLLVSTAQAATTYTVLHHFGSGQDGASPLATLTPDAFGNFYGTTGVGGADRLGTVFELIPSPGGTWTQTIIHSFTHNDGDGPEAGVVFDSQGNLYGATTGGGPTDLGTVYQLSPDGQVWTLTIVYEYGALVDVTLDGAGKLYAPTGTGAYDNGAVGELSPSPSGWTYNALYSFCAQPNCSDGSTPSATFVFDARGNLYGTTLYGGNRPPTCKVDSEGCGVVFELTPNRDGTWSYHLIHAFASFANDAEVALGSLLVDRNGSLYGTAPLGGSNYNSGMVFKFTPSTTGTAWKESAVYTFPDCTQGCGPYNGVVSDKAGNLYGTTAGGTPACGGFSCGIVYRLSPQRNGKWKYTKLHEFSGPDGMFPNPVIVGPDGNIYGTTQAGGKYNLGVAFEISP